ncbi:MAG: pentapeptide repeat-containing protein [Candidatus Binatia bacterium]
MTNAKIAGARFAWANLTRAVIAGITPGFNLVGANFKFANLHEAKLRGASLGVQAGPEGGAATLRSAFMTDVDPAEPICARSISPGRICTVRRPPPISPARGSIPPTRATLCAGARFSGTLNNAVFNKVQLVNTVFNGATLTGAEFDDSYLQGADSRTRSA